MAETFDPSQLRVLVVDDNQQMREILRTILRAFGVTEVTVAIDGAHALEKLDADRFDLAICDWMMAPMDGLTFVQTVRKSQRPSVRGLPVLMLTAQAEKQNVIDARRAGVDAYLVKPVSAAQLWARLQPIAARSVSARRTEDGTAARAIAAAGSGMSHMTTAYREVLRMDCDDLGRALSLMVRSDWNSTGVWQGMFKKAHDVKGQAGSFGYVLATDLAGRLCTTLRPVLDDFARRNARPEPLKTLLGTIVGALELIAREDMAGDGGSEGYGLLAQVDAELDALLVTWGATR